jgi:hypothetical protein
VVASWLIVPFLVSLVGLVGWLLVEGASRLSQEWTLWRVRRALARRS